MNTQQTELDYLWIQYDGAISTAKMWKRKIDEFHKKKCKVKP